MIRPVNAATSGSTTGNYFDHVLIILMENQGLADICAGGPPPCSGSNGAPYLAGLSNNYSLAAQYVSLVHHSNPNYNALIGGSTFGCNNDPCPPVSAPNLVDLLESAGLTWKGYMEDQSTSSGCDTVAHAPYTPQHNPFDGFTDILNSSARCSRIVLANPQGCPVTDCALINDLNSGLASNFMWLTPNYCNDMHGFTYPNGTQLCPTSISHGDSYLSNLIPNILSSQTFTTERSALFIVFDEGNSYCPLNRTSEDCVYAAWAGPVIKNMFTSTNFYDHNSFTRTVEANWNLPSLTSNDASATPMSEFFVNNPPVTPSATIGFNFSPARPSAGQAVSFNASVSGGSTPYIYSWSFGDNGTASGVSPTRAYRVAGPFDVVLTVTDSNGGVARTSRTIVVTQASPLTVGFTYNPSQPVQGQTVTFTASASGGVAPYSLTWGFGDGTTSASNPATHSYFGEGPFTVTIKVVDANAANAMSSQTIMVASSLTASFTNAPSSPDAGQTTFFTGSASGGISPYSYSWSFGDDSARTGPSSSHAFGTSGSYVVVLTVTDANGFTASSSKTITVHPRPSASFSYTPSNPLPLIPVSFTATAWGGAGPYSYSWTFGDGSTGSGASKSHTYLLPGTYSVTLIVTDANGQTFATSQKITVLTGAPGL